MGDDLICFRTREAGKGAEAMLKFNNFCVHNKYILKYEGGILGWHIHRLSTSIDDRKKSSLGSNVEQKDYRDLVY